MEAVKIVKDGNKKNWTERRGVILDVIHTEGGRMEVGSWRELVGSGLWGFCGTGNWGFGWFG